jgi:hypothetical protein
MGRVWRTRTDCCDGWDETDVSGWEFGAQVQRTTVSMNT